MIMLWNRVFASKLAVVSRVGISAHPYRVALFVTISVFMGFGVVSAQDATPAPTSDVPPAELCTVKAPSFDELNAIIATPLAEGTPIAIRTPGVVPDGTPADPETVAAVTATIRELVGCFNAGEPLRSFGLYTTPYLNRLFNRQEGFSQVVYDSYATPEPTDDPSAHTAILEIKEIRLQADGSAGATVTLRYASIPMPKTFYFSFSWNGERWMIDGILGEISFSVP